MVRRNEGVTCCPHQCNSSALVIEGGGCQVTMLGWEGLGNAAQAVTEKAGSGVQLPLVISLPL